jgi:glutamate synthase (NADPH/NADH) small chain
MLRTSSSHEEGGTRDFGVMTERFVGKDGKVTEVHCVRVDFEKGQFVKRPGSEFVLKADLVLLAMGFVSPEKPGLVTQLGAELDGRGNLKIDDNAMTSIPGVFAAGDCQRGQSLVVWAIADGRRAARGIDRFLLGQSEL